MSLRCAISSMSLGRAWHHSLPNKLDQARRYGITGIEIFYEDLQYLARETGKSKDPSPTELLAAAHVARHICDERGLEIICLQPFMHYEGLRDRQKHAKRIDEMHLWIELATIMGTDVILVPSTFLDENEVTGDINVIVGDLREIAELGLQHAPPIRFAYEALCWGTYVNTWEQAWNVISLVDRPNFGFCVDTYNLAGRYADPADPSGWIPNAHSELQASLKMMKTTIDINKVFLVQLVDAARLGSPIIPGHELYDPSQPARMSWSRAHRLFYGEQSFGAYLPIYDVFKVVKDLGYQGWVSAELFNHAMSESGPDVPERLARRAAISWQKFVKDFEPESAQAIENRL